MSTFPHCAGRVHLPFLRFWTPALHEDRHDPLAAFLRGQVWAQEAVPGLHRRMRELERAAVVERDPERLCDLQSEHAQLRRIADPEHLLRLIRKKPRASGAGDSDELDEPDLGPSEDEL